MEINGVVAVGKDRMLASLGTSCITGRADFLSGLLRGGTEGMGYERRYGGSETSRCWVSSNFLYRLLAKSRETTYSVKTALHTEYFREKLLSLSTIFLSNDMYETFCRRK